MILGQKLGNQRMLLRETFCFREHHDFETKIKKSENLRKIYFVPFPTNFFNWTAYVCPARKICWKFKYGNPTFNEHLDLSL